MQIRLTNTQGTYDVTSLVTNVRWAGDYKQAARSLDISLVSTPTDASVPTVASPLGSGVQMVEAGEVMFDGFVISRTGSTGSSTLELKCYDRGFYLKRNKGFYNFADVTPESVVQKLAGDFGIALGEIASTDVNVSRKFMTGNDTLYDIISTVYTLASQSTEKKYHVGFRGDKLCVFVREPGTETLVVQGGSNLMTATTTEKMDDLVSAVSIYDQNDNLVQTIEDAERTKLYGYLHEIVKQTQDDDKSADAQQLLDDGHVKQTISVDCLGNVGNVTGGCVIVREPHTGVDGLFYIDSDTHEWKRGQYYNKLVLNFQNIMYEQQSGSES